MIVGGARLLARLGIGALVAWATTCTGYLLILLLVARGAATGGVPLGDVRRTLTLVPAHNEEKLIAECVRALLAQDIPPALHRVVVIADNCADATHDLAAAAGAEVWNRTAPKARGKGQALAWAFDRLSGEPGWAEVIGVVDADCLASPNLCRAWSGVLNGAVSAAQADYVISNPEASRAAARRWAGFALKHRVRAAGKQRLGLSTGLFGTGMAFTADSLVAVPWSSFSVTEDVEYHVQLVEAGQRAAFTTVAQVASPAPDSEHAAQVQQLRWESGNVALAARTVPRLLRDGLHRRDMQRLHLGLEQLVPAQSVLVLALAGAGGGAALLGHRQLARAAATGLTGQVTFVVGGLALARAPGPVWRALASAPVLVMSKAGQLVRIFTGRGAAAWTRTAR